MTNPQQPHEPVPPQMTSDTAPLEHPTAEAARQPALRRHGVAIGVGATCLVVGGLIGGGIGWAASGHGGSGTTRAEARDAASAGPDATSRVVPLPP